MVIQNMVGLEGFATVLTRVGPEVLVDGADVLLEAGVPTESFPADLTLVRSFPVVDCLDVSGEVTVLVELLAALAS